MLFSPLFCQLIGEKIPAYNSLTLIVNDSNQVLHANLRQQELYSVPFELQSTKNIEVLNLMKNRIVSLPTWFCELEKLRELNLKQNGLESLPECFSDLLALQHLKLEKNSLDNAQIKKIQDLTSLEHLYLSKNKLQTWSEGMETLKNLRILYLDHNALTKLESEAFAADSKLEIVNVSVNALEAVPASLFECRQLGNLNLSKNQLKSLPQISKEHKALRVLDLSYNQLQSLPDLSKFHQLSILSLSFNELSTVLEQVKGLKQLKHLYLVGNEISTAEIEEIKKALPGCKVWI